MCDPLRLATLVVTDKRSMRGLVSAFSRTGAFYAPVGVEAVVM
jgi:hypothetical protein